ncbi:MAG: cellulase family glycosylhydrolase [Lachnospiraceae bacterium]|nr:cellulase family glycosylhydrolase [Lachnospiraceae bacterium]
MRLLKKVCACALSVVLATTTIQFVGPSRLNIEAASAGIANSDFLKANGRDLKNNFGKGAVVTLRGVNAGSVSVQEPWMTNTANSQSVNAQIDIINTLTRRFGSETAKNMLRTYRDNYWVESDFDKVADMGMNCIRLPLWYRDFVDENNNWYSDAFAYVDWFVKKASERGIYVIIDMHGAYGSQNGSDHSGIDGGNAKEAASKFFFGNEAAANQERYYQMWERIAEHFRGNPAVAGYDLLNEPYCTYRYSSSYSEEYLHNLLWGIYDQAYRRIRAKDSDHVIIMEATWDEWDLPNPNNYGWTNVMYEYHQYEYSNYYNEDNKQITSLQNKINNMKCMGYDVPRYMGEFNLFNNMDAWKTGLQMLNNEGFSWTIWSYKCKTDNDNWGLYKNQANQANLDYDSYDTIMSKWSAASLGSTVANTQLINVVKGYTSGTVKTIDFAGISNGNYSLVCNDKVVCTDAFLNPVYVAANRDVWGSNWETLEIVNNNDGTISFRSGNTGKYVCAVIDEPGNKLVSRSDQIGDWEKFKLVNIQSNQYGIYSCANGNFVKADFGDTECPGVLKAESSSIAGAWEAFYFNRLDTQQQTTQQPQTEPQTQPQTQPQSDIPNGFTKAPQEQWITSGNYGVYFGTWNGTAEGAYKEGNPYQIYVSKANKGATWLIQGRYEQQVTSGHTYKVTAKITTDKNASIGIKEDLSNESSGQVYTNLTANVQATLTGTYTVTQDRIRVMFELGQGVDDGTTIRFDSVEIKDITEEQTTVEQPTTEATTHQNENPEVINWDNIAYVIDGAGEGIYANQYKFYSNASKVSAVNIQKPGFATAAGIYVTVPAGIGSCSLPSGTYDIQGAGIIIHVDALAYGVTTFTITDAMGTYACAVNRTQTEPQTEPHKEPQVSISGYQLNYVSEGFRTSYRITNSDETVEEIGLIYGRADWCEDEEMVVKSDNSKVYSFAATEKGHIYSGVDENGDSYDSYNMTMLYGNCKKEFFSGAFMIRAYIKLTNGEYIYSEIEKISIYDVAEYIYANLLSQNEVMHNYLYDRIISRVNNDYEPKIYQM